MAKEKLTIVLDIPYADSGTIHSIIDGIMKSEEPPDSITEIVLSGELEDGSSSYSQDVTYMMETYNLNHRKEE